MVRKAKTFNGIRQTNWKAWMGCWMIVLALSPVAMAQFSLWMVEQTVKLKHPVPGISHQEFQDRVRSPKAIQYVVFDTRKSEEYRVSRLSSAIQVDPDMESTTFMDQFGEMIKGKKLIFYCSVVYRSSIFVERIRQEALAHGAQSLANLTGGIFRWFNEGNIVVDDAGPVDTVHPFSAKWGEMVKKREPSRR